MAGKHEAIKVKSPFGQRVQAVGRWFGRNGQHVAHAVALHAAALLILNKGSYILPFLAH